MKKRGMSEIIAVVLIVLLTFAAAGMIVAFVVPFVKNNLNEGTECFAYKDYFSFEQDFGLNCYITNGQERDYYVSIKAKTTKEEIENKVEGLKILFQTGENVKVFDVENGVATQSGNGMLSMIPRATTFSVPSGGEIRSYHYNDTIGESFYEKVEVYPLLKNGKLCEKSDAVEIEPCSQEIINQINIINAP